MFFPGFLTTKEQKNVYIFNNYSTFCHVWSRPADCKFLFILCIGAGGGGGGGYSASVGFSAGSGGGGGGGTITSALIPAVHLPQTLYISPGLGGTGSPSLALNTTGALGSTGGTSYVFTDDPDNNPNLGVDNFIVIQAAGGAGGSGGASNNGTGGSEAGSIFTYETTPYWSNSGLVNARGKAGGFGGGATNIETPHASFNSIVTGGGGGGGITAAGLAYNGKGIDASAIIPGLIIGGGVPGSKAPSGVYIRKPLFFTGGAGGAGSATNPAWAGGDGAYGSGGGGGGGCNAGVNNSGGTGGKGGDGFIMIVCI